MSIRHWPRSERPREKLIECGPHALSDAELLAVLIGCGRKGRSAVELARVLIADFGSLRELLSADRTRWVHEHAPGKGFGTSRHAGIGPARYATMQAALELTRRHYRESLRVGPALNAPDATRKFLLAQLRDRPYEVFCCLYLDNRHRLIAFEELFRGTLNGASVYPREVLRQTLFHNAAALILAHNHPSGALEPSQPDELITSRLRDALALVDVRVLDHFIVGDGRCFSFAEQGLL
jgi:DNA repair protein RadC